MRVWLVALILALVGASKFEFGVYDGEDPGLDKLNHAGGWAAVDLPALLKVKSEFVDFYNKNGGLTVIKGFKSKNCCFALKGGKKLSISGTKYKVAFPASGGKLQCNPKDGYTMAKLQFYGVKTLSKSQKITSNDGCKTSHNPTLFVREVADIAHDKLDFAVYDGTASPGGNWNLMSVDDFKTYRKQFISHYNANGLRPIKSWESKSCCFAVKGGESLMATGTKYGFLFPASTRNTIRCNPKGGYKEAAYKFYQSNQLKADTTFMAKKYCPFSHNPAVYLRIPAKAATGTKFGIYAHTASPGAGWRLMSLKDIQDNRKSFIQQYNANKGLAVIKNFKTRNCCFALDGGMKLTISGTPYKYQFPATRTGGIRCNPTAGYTETHYQFYRTPTLLATQTFGETTACATSTNPGLFIFEVEDAKKEFGIADVAEAPAGGWKLITAAQLKKYRNVFAAHYNKNRGLGVIKSFKSDNCCIAVGDNKMLAISGTKYGFQFPANKAGDVKCNPSGGYRGKYAFYGVEAITTEMKLMSKVACKIGHNPAIYIRGAMPPTTAPTTAPTRAPTQPYHCKVSGWNVFSTCTAKCGPGFKTHTRSIIATGSAPKCPKLTQTVSCELKDCPIHCKVSKWGAFSKCNAACGGGLSTRKRTIATPPKHSGDRCPSLHNSVVCNTHKCPVHCKVAAWSTWGKCSVECGTGVMKRTRKVVETPKYDGNTCPALKETKGCNTSPCKQHCKVGGWGKWSKCTAQCGGGEQSRKRAIKMDAKFGGTECPALKAFQKCNTQDCVKHCKVSKFSEWSTCSKECGGGKMVRKRKILQLNDFKGDKCAPLEEEMRCNDKACSNDCLVSEWSSFGKCSNKCGGGYQSRYRDVIRDAKFGGKKCPLLEHDNKCNTGSCDCPPGQHRDSRASDCQKCSKDWFKAGVNNDMCTSCPKGTSTKGLRGAASCACKAVDCKVTAWSKFTTCTKTCGTGIKTAVRKVTKKPNSCGKKCPALRKETSCATKACPVNCVLSSWQKWNKCSASCGGGKQKRMRSVTRAASAGGLKCGVKKNTRDCGAANCPVDCVVDKYSTWSSCSKKCGTGKRTRSRMIAVPAAHGGKKCPLLLNSEKCNTDPCTMTCKVSEWSAWSVKCTKTCGGGKQTRTRSVLSRTKHCPAVKATRTCNEQACPVDCVVNTWSTWSDCPASCGGGLQTSWRTIGTPASAGGKACGPTTKTRVCNKASCPVDCIVGKFSKWGKCSKSCGGGQARRGRSIQIESEFGGKACAPLTDDRVCNKASCPLDCSVSVWGDWSQCSKQCGGGMRQRRRSTTIENAFGGKVCPALVAFNACNVKACKAKETSAPTPKASSPTPSPGKAVHCMVSAWGNWGTCSVKCGGGVQTRYREMVREPRNGGDECPSLSDSQACNTKKCSGDCKFSWGKWSSCSKTCGTGKQTRNAAISKSSKGGKKCPSKQEQLCNTDACPIDCTLSSWGEFTKCSKKCNVGIQYRMRKIVSNAKFGGKPCQSLFDQKKCNTFLCPINCKLSAWTSFGKCSTSCGSGIKTRTRDVIHIARHGGTACGNTEIAKSCAKDSCPVDCVVSGWGKYSACSKTCGGGAATRRRSVKRAAVHGGKKCPAIKASTKCNTRRCPVDCVTANWNAWTECTVTCGGKGTKVRTRRAKVASAYGGVKCDLRQSKSCGTQKCPVHCDVGAWSNWSDCTKTCGTGTKTRTRKIVSKASAGGRTCPDLVNDAHCATTACPVDCDVSDWGKWSGCSATCGGGKQTRSRYIIQYAYNKGKKCPALAVSADCGTEKCPTHCEVGSWGRWAACDATCGGGQRVRTRKVTVKASNGGDACPTIKRSVSCNAQPCPLDCVMTAYGKWGKCSKTCGGGKQHRARKVISAAQHGGKECGAIKNSQACSTDCCPGYTSHRGGCAQCLAGTFQWENNCDACPSGKYQSKLGQNKCDACMAGTFGKAGKGHITSSRADGYASDYHCQHCPAGKFQEADGSPTCAHCPSGYHMSGMGGLKCTACASGKYTKHLAGQSHCVNSPIACKVSDWSEYSTCSTTCGPGSQERFRTVSIKASHGGTPCPTLTQKQACHKLKACPVDCSVSTYSSWSACSKSCGSGFRTRSRRATRKAAFGGKKCPSLKGVAKCNTFACPVNCLAGPWGKYGACTASCGGGKAYRKRGIIRHVKNGGVKCPALVGSTTCNSKYCPVDCTVSTWGVYSECSVTCGKGSQARTRSVMIGAGLGGKKCPSMKTSKACNMGNCPIHCTVSAWSKWTSCSASCGVGLKTRMRAIEKVAAHGGYKCPSLKETDECKSKECPVHCTASEWGAWSACSKTCGKGSINRKRSIIEKEMYGGKPCGKLAQASECITKHCTVDCTVADWKPWTKCSATCGGGSQMHNRKVLKVAAHGGKACPNLEAHRICNKQPCPVDCAVGKWGKWSSCTQSCGDGYQHKYRQVQKIWAFGGIRCPNLVHKRSCNPWPCPIDCAVDDWSGWTACTKSCAGGTQKRNRAMIENHKFGGKACPKLAEKMACNTESCPVDCTVSGWSKWTTCTMTCGGGKQERSRVIQTAARHGGACPRLADKRVCENSPCPEHCFTDVWSDYTKCDKSCGSGSKMRERKVIKIAMHGGDECPDLKQTATCNTHVCPVDCVLSKWTAWSTCTKSCGKGGGKQHRGKTIVHKALYGGKGCVYGRRQSRICNTFTCPVDCTFHPWEKWSKCTKKCGDGTQKRIRHMKTENKYGGACAAVFAHRHCHVKPCPIDCDVEGWSDYGKCDKTCGIGSKTAVREMITKPQFGGKACPYPLKRVALCNTHPCPVDCVVSKWTKLSACTKSCYDGTSSLKPFQRKTRKILTTTKHGGKNCPPIVKFTACNTHRCPIDCQTAGWGDWGWTDKHSCSAKCGKGFHNRQRKITKMPQFGGKTCGKAKGTVLIFETRACIGTLCPIHCKVSNYGAYGKCNAECGGGKKTRKRSVVSHAKHGGYTCPSLSYATDCNTHGCPVDCVLTTWTKFTTCTKTCGGGTQKRTRKVTKTAKFGGECIAPLLEVKECAKKICPIDCEVTKWGEWGECDRACGKGQRHQVRKVLVEGAHGGIACPKEIERKEVCFVKECGCSHVYCKRMAPGHIKVFHHQKEEKGNKHICKYNHKYKDCECTCSFSEASMV
jgi:hypothetical protein